MGTLAYRYLKDGSGHYQPGRGYRQSDGSVVILSDIVVHEFKVSDTEDPDLHAAVPLSKWESSEAGQWVFANCAEPPHWIREFAYSTYYDTYRVVAGMTEAKQTFFKLKFR